MAENEILVKLKIEENRATRQLKEVKESVNSLDRRTKKYKETVAQQVNLEAQLSSIRKRRIAENKKLEVSVANLTKKQQQQQDATGSATSATMELSRVISDAPYGIRGMANNITQLVSQLGTASTKAGGLTAALKLMGKQLMGPLGIVFAITAVVSALDYFFGAQKKSEEATKSHNKVIKKQITLLQKLENIKGAISNSLFADSDNDALDKYNKGLLTTEQTVKIITRNFNDFSNAYEKLTEEQKKDEKNVKALLDGYQELLSLRELEKSQQDSLLKLRGVVDKQDKKAKERKAKGYKDALEFISVEKQELGRLEKDYIATQKRLLKLEDYFSKEKDKSSKSSKSSPKLSPFKTKKELEIDIKDNEAAIIQYEKQTEAFRLKEEMNDKLSAANTEEEKLKIKQNYQRDLLLSQIKAEKDLLLLRKSTEESVVKEKTKNHIADLKRIYEKYLLELKLNTKISDAEKERLKSDATSSFFNSLTQASGEEIKSLGEIDTKYKELIKTLGVLSDAKLSALFSGFFGGGEDGSQSEVMKITDQIQIYKDLISSVGDFIGGEYDRQMTMEQNKTNALNAELNNRLLNENLSKEERQRIQNEIGQNDERLRVKQEAIARKKFNTEKAFNIAVATTDTIVAGLSAAKATYGGPVAKIAAMTATIGAGLAQVAVIARTKFQSSSANTPINTGGGAGDSGGVGDREFNFNLVGNTQENQLLETLQGQFDRPLQAFVVSKDITTQQELDANIQGQARI